jgi:O-acetylserine/cysteine efflux transporter
MTPRDRLLAALVAVCWGINFPATALALEHFPPLFLVALRFALVAIPTLIFIPRPKVPVRWLVGVGLGIGVAQFAFLYLGMAAGMPSGLASLVLQASAPLTVLIAGVWLREKITPRQAVGIAIAVLGLAAIAVHRSQAAALLPVVLTLCGALGWAIGNVCSRKAQAPNALHLTLWMSVVPPIPMLALALVVEGPVLIGESLATAFTLEALPSVLGLLYVVIVATIVGYGIWNGLMSRYPSSIVAPFSMLVPVVGVLASWVAFRELIDAVEFAAGIAVVGGVLIASSVSRTTRRRRAAAAATETADTEAGATADARAGAERSSAASGVTTTSGV